MNVSRETSANWCDLCDHPVEWHVEPCTSWLCACVRTNVSRETSEEVIDMT